RRASVAGHLGGRAIVLALGLARMTLECASGAGKRGRILERDQHARRDEFEVRAIGFLRVEPEGLFTHGGPHASAEHMAVVVLNLPEGAPIDYRVFLVPARSFLA